MEVKMAEVYHQTEQLGPNAPLEELIFSNRVVLEGIYKYLSTQDLLRTSLVSQIWFIESRKALTNSKRRHAVCIQIDYHSPCRTLLTLNDFLEETLRTTDHPVIFNGIKLRSNEQYIERYRCHNCLKNNWLAGVDLADDEDGTFRADGRQWSDEHDQLIMDKLPEMFGNILGKMKLQYIYLYDRLAWYCPFAILIKWWIRERPESIWELHFDVNSDDVQYNYGAYVIFNTPNYNKTFPNLEALGVGRFSENAEGVYLPCIVAPSLTTITLRDARYNPQSTPFRFQPNFPRHALTNLKIGTNKVKTAMSFIDEFHPKIEVLRLKRKSNQGLLIQEDLFRLGRLISTTLKELTCSSSILALLVCGMNQSNDCESMIKNKFPVLELLELQSSLVADVLECFNSIHFSHDFPTLKTVRLELVAVDSADDAVAYDGSDNPKMIGNGGAEFIKDLSLKTRSIKRKYTRCAIHSLNIFRHISHLDLKGMPFYYDGDDGVFRRLLSKIQTLQFLKEITIRSTDLSSFCLDDLILRVHSETKERLKEMNLERLLVYTSSILDHPGLEKINIHGNRICTERLNDAGVSVCHSNQTPDTFLVSSEIAKLICKLRPGFKFCLEILGACIPECTSGFHPGGLRLEHLEPFAKISARQPPGITFKRFWEIQFLNEDQENSTTYDCIRQN